MFYSSPDDAGQSGGSEDGQTTRRRRDPQVRILTRSAQPSELTISELLLCIHWKRKSTGGGGNGVGRQYVSDSSGYLGILALSDAIFFAVVISGLGRTGFLLFSARQTNPGPS